jgi:ABC-type metal ion transport system substrate-binding protein
VEKFCEEFEINIVASMLGPLDSLSISNGNHLVSSTFRSSESDVIIDEETGKENYDFVNFIKTKRESKDDSTVDDLEESTTESK